MSAGILVELAAVHPKDRSYVPAVDIHKISVEYIYSQIEKMQGDHLYVTESAELDKITKIHDHLMHSLSESPSNILLKDLCLQADVSLRTVGQRDPLLEFKQEAFRLFDEMSRTMRLEMAHDLFRFRLLTLQEVQQRPTIPTTVTLERNRSLADEVETEQKSTQWYSYKPEKTTPLY